MSVLNGGRLNALFNIVRSNVSTGLLKGGEITINGGDNTKLDIAAGSGFIVDNTDPENITVFDVSWDAKVAVTPEFLATNSSSFISEEPIFVPQNEQ